MKVLLLILLYATYSCDGSKILGVFNHPAVSHTFLGRILLENLAERGHEVTMITAFPKNENLTNFKEISLESILSKKIDDKYSTVSTIAAGLQHTKDTFENPEVQHLIRSGAKFDVVILEMFYNEGCLMFGHIFNAPVIYLGAFGNNLLLNDITGNFLPCSYVPGLALYEDDDISFVNRIKLAVANVIIPLFLPRIYKKHDNLLKAMFTDAPSIEKLQENVALVLAYGHYSFETPRPNTPNIIPVGGFHIKDPKPLEWELQRFLDDAKEGVIYFSLGSQILSSSFTNETVQNILKAFGRMNEKVLWKYEDDNLKNLPKNVRIQKWFSQNDVLAHANIKLFITHGGTGGFTEGVYNSLPMVGIPSNGDQATNIAFAVSRGFAELLIADNFTEENFYNVVQQVLQTPSYKERANYYGSLLRNQPMKPLDTAAYWVEHVIQYKGAKHLQPFSRKLPWYKFYLIDVIGALLLAAYMFYRCLKFFVIQCIRVIALVFRKQQRKVKTN